MQLPDLSLYDNSWYSPGRGKFVRALWLFFGLPVLKCQFLPFSSVRRFILRSFGATICRGVVLKPGIHVKYPWLLSIGENTWIGEDAWIDNLGDVRIGANVCISQGAHLCTGNHDWADPRFGLSVRSIVIEDGAWVGMRALVCPGTRIGRCAVATAGSVITQSIPPFEIHAGNPAQFVKRRVFSKSGEDPADSLASSFAAPEMEGA